MKKKMYTHSIGRKRRNHKELAELVYWNDDLLMDTMMEVQALRRELEDAKREISWLKIKDGYSDKQIDYWIDEVENNKKSLKECKHTIANIPAKFTLICEED